MYLPNNRIMGHSGTNEQSNLCLIFCSILYSQLFFKNEVKNIILSHEYDRKNI